MAFALYILLAEHAVGLRDPVSLLCLGFAVAAVFWAVVQPWWSFPVGIVDDQVRLDGALIATTTPAWLLMVTMIVVGTILPFLLLVGALRHISATRVAVTAMFEPVAEALVTYAWLGEELSVPHVTGGAIVLAGILLAQQPAKSPQTAKNSILYKPASTARKVQKLSALQVGLVWLSGYGLPLTS